MNEFFDLADEVRKIVRAEALQTSPPTERFRVVSLDPLRLEAFHSDEMLQREDFDLARGVYVRLEVGDTVFVDTDRDGDRIVTGSFAGGDNDDAGGGGSEDKNRIIYVTEPTDVWEIEHNLGKFPSIQTFATTGRKLNGRLEHLTVNTARVTFNHSNAGKAVCN